jgi:hypothetical protein
MAFQKAISPYPRLAANIVPFRNDQETIVHYTVPMGFKGRTFLAWLLAAAAMAYTAGCLWLLRWGQAHGAAQPAEELLHRRARGIEREQIKWLLFAGGLFVASMPLDFFSVPWSGVITNLISLAIPLAIATAILRYRLFDIDVIIRRTTSYALITGLLALVYFASIVVLQGAFGRLTNFDSTPAVVLSTLLIAALFLPIRRRVQDLIDRRFNRTRYDAEKTLARFAATARDETDLDALLAELVRVIETTMQPEAVSVWLRPTKELRIEESQKGMGTALL